MTRPLREESLNHSQLQPLAGVPCCAAVQLATAVQGTRQWYAPSVRPQRVQGASVQSPSLRQTASTHTPAEQLQPVAGEPNCAGLQSEALLQGGRQRREPSLSVAQRDQGETVQSPSPPHVASTQIASEQLQPLAGVPSCAGLQSEAALQGGRQCRRPLSSTAQRVHGASVQLLSVAQTASSQMRPLCSVKRSGANELSRAARSLVGALARSRTPKSCPHKSCVPEAPRSRATLLTLAEPPQPASSKQNTISRICRRYYGRRFLRRQSVRKRRQRDIPRRQPLNRQQPADISATAVEKAPGSER